MKWNEHQSSGSATHRHLPWEPAIYLYKDSILCCCSCWPSTPTERSSGWRNEALCAGGEGETGRSGLQIVRYFQEPILYTQFLYLLICRKALKSFMETIVSCDQQKASRGLRQLSGKCLLDCIYSPFPKITYILTFPATSLEQFLWGSVSWAAVLMLPPNKIYLITLTFCIFF